MPVNTPNIVRHESEGLNFISADNCLDFHVCKLWEYAFEEGRWAITLVVNNADNERLVRLASFAHPNSKTDWPATHLLQRTRVLSVRSGYPLGAKMTPPYQPFNIVRVGVDLEKHELLVLHVMILANGVLVVAIHRTEHLGRVARHWAVDCRLKASEVLLVPGARQATCAIAKASDSCQVVICHSPVCFILIRAAIECSTPERRGLCRTGLCHDSLLWPLCILHAEHNSDDTDYYSLSNPRCQMGFHLFLVVLLVLLVLLWRQHLNLRNLIRI